MAIGVFFAEESPARQDHVAATVMACRSRSLQEVSQSPRPQDKMRMTSQNTIKIDRRPPIRLPQSLQRELHLARTGGGAADDAGRSGRAGWIGAVGGVKTIRLG